MKDESFGSLSDSERRVTEREDGEIKEKKKNKQTNIILIKRWINNYYYF